MYRQYNIHSLNVLISNDFRLCLFTFPTPCLVKAKMLYIFYYHTSTFVQHEITAYKHIHPEAVDQYSMNFFILYMNSLAWLGKMEKAHQPRKICINMKEMAKEEVDETFNEKKKWVHCIYLSALLPSPHIPSHYCYCQHSFQLFFFHSFLGKRIDIA